MIRLNLTPHFYIILKGEAYSCYPLILLAPSFPRSLLWGNRFYQG